MTDEDQQERVDSIVPGTAAFDPAAASAGVDAADDATAGPHQGAAMAATDRHPPTGAMSAERLAMKALEARLLGGERKLRRREVAAGAGLSLLSARKLWRARGSRISVTRTSPSPNGTRQPCPPWWTWSAPASSRKKPPFR